MAPATLPATVVAREGWCRGSRARPARSRGADGHRASGTARPAPATGEVVVGPRRSTAVRSARRRSSARRPAAGMAPAHAPTSAARGARPDGDVVPHRDPRAAECRPGAARGARVGPDGRRCTRCVPRTRGASGTSATSTAGRVGGAATSAPVSFWSTRCTPARRPRRWSRRRTCRPRAGSSTRCICGSRRYPNSPMCGTAAASARRGPMCRRVPTSRN